MSVRGLMRPLAGSLCLLQCLALCFSPHPHELKEENPGGARYDCLRGPLCPSLRSPPDV